MKEVINNMGFEVYKLYNKLETGPFFNTYHDLFLSISDEFETFEDDAIDLEMAMMNLDKAKAIIQAQQILKQVHIK